MSEKSRRSPGVKASEGRGKGVASAAAGPGRPLQPQLPLCVGVACSGRFVAMESRKTWSSGSASLTWRGGRGHRVGAGVSAVPFSDPPTPRGVQSSVTGTALSPRALRRRVFLSLGCAPGVELQGQVDPALPCGVPSDCAHLRPHCWAQRLCPQRPLSFCRPAERALESPCGFRGRP